MIRASLPRALALSVLTMGLCAAGAQQAQPMPDTSTPQQTAPVVRPHRHHSPERQARMLSRRLNLTPDQTARVTPILAQRDQQMEALRANQQLSPEDRHQQMHSLNEQTRQQMAGVLTPDQMTELQAMRHHHGHHNQGAAPMQDGQSPS